MSKENYERDRAERKMREEIQEARKFSKDAEGIHMMLYMGACMIQEREAENPVGTAEAIWISTKKRAAELATHQ